MDARTKCFRCYRRPLLDPKELNVSICRQDHGDYDARQLLLEWRKIVVGETTMCLTLELKDAWPNNDKIWTQLCDFVKETSSQIHGFSTTLL